jgi:hypothetical protein
MCLSKFCAKPAITGAENRPPAQRLLAARLVSDGTGLLPLYDKATLAAKRGTGPPPVPTMVIAKAALDRLKCCDGGQSAYPCAVAAGHFCIGLRRWCFHDGSWIGYCTKITSAGGAQCTSQLLTG